MAETRERFSWDASIALASKACVGRLRDYLIESFANDLEVRGFLPGVHFAGHTQARTLICRAIRLPNCRAFVFNRKTPPSGSRHPKYGEFMPAESAILKAAARGEEGCWSSATARCPVKRRPAALTAPRCFPIIAANRLSSRAREDSTPSNSSEGRDEQASHRGRRKVRTYSLWRRRTVFTAKTVYRSGAASTGLPSPMGAGRLRSGYCVSK